jgi:hypothetical protein
MNTTTDLPAKYEIPDEVMAFVRDGFLEVVSEDEAKKTVEFHAPSKRRTDDEGRITSWSVVWIHPDHNAEFCHYYDEKPGDLPNFYVLQDTTDVGDELVDGIDSVDDLVGWLEGLEKSDS